MGLVDASASMDGWVWVGFEGVDDWISCGDGSSVHSLVGLLSSSSLKMKARHICSSSSIGEGRFGFGVDGWALWFVWRFIGGSFPVSFEVGRALNDLVSSISSSMVKLLQIDSSSSFDCSLSLSRSSSRAGDRISFSRTSEDSRSVLRSLVPANWSLLFVCDLLPVDA